MLSACGGAASTAPTNAAPPSVSLTTSSPTPSPSTPTGYEFQLATPQQYKATVSAQIGSPQIELGAPTKITVAAPTTGSMSVTNTTPARTLPVSGGLQAHFQWQLPPEVARSLMPKKLTPATGDLSNGCIGQDCDNSIIFVSVLAGGGVEKGEASIIPIDGTAEVTGAYSSTSVGIAPPVVTLLYGTREYKPEFSESNRAALEALFEQPPTVVYLTEQAFTLGNSSVYQLCDSGSDAFNVQVLGVDDGTSGSDLTFAQAKETPGQPCNANSARS